MTAAKKHRAGIQMKKLTLVLATLAAAGPSVGYVASAADFGGPAPAAMYTKAPTAVPYSWTGFYAGGNWGYESASWQVRPTFIDPSFIPEYQAYLPGELANNLSDNRALGGVQIGYNHQIGRFVLGVEADYDFSRLKASRNTGFIPGPFPVPGHNAEFSENVGSDNLGTVRGRLGATFDNFLIYGTGGLAVTSASFSRSVILLNGTEPFTGPGVSGTIIGWAAGGGFEYRLTSAWSIKAEYLHADFGSESVHLQNLIGVRIDSDARLTTDVVRGGINYHF